jgi:hypothetical protein
LATDPYNDAAAVYIAAVAGAGFRRFQVFKVIGILICSMFVTNAALAKDWPTWWHHHPDTVSAPEIDPASALSGLTLLVGGLAVVRGRRKK